MPQMHKNEIVTEVGTLIGEWHCGRRIGPLREIGEVWPVCLAAESDYSNLRDTLERVLNRWPHEMDQAQNKRIRRLIGDLARRSRVH